MTRASCQRNSTRIIGLAAVTLLLIGLVLPGCKDKKPLRGDEDIEAVVAADKRLAAQENKLLSRRGALQRERRKLQDKRVELISRKMALPQQDAQEREKLEQEETQLADLESKLLKQEIALNEKLQSLLNEKTDLVDKIASDKSGKDVLVARREYGIAVREKDLARREAEVARREKDLAKREQVFSERLAKGCPAPATIVQTVAAPARESGSYSRKDVEPIYRAALKAMQAKGILTADLPSGADRLVTEVRHSISGGDYVRAKYAADQLLAVVRKLKVDRTFIGAKISRLSNAIRQRPPPAGKKERANALFQKATASYGDGQFIKANRQLNDIYDLLQ